MFYNNFLGTDQNNVEIKITLLIPIYTWSLSASGPDLEWIKTRYYRWKNIYYELGQSGPLTVLKPTYPTSGFRTFQQEREERENAVPQLARSSIIN